MLFQSADKKKTLIIFIFSFNRHRRHTCRAQCISFLTKVEAIIAQKTKVRVTVWHRGKYHISEERLNVDGEICTILELVPF